MKANSDFGRSAFGSACKVLLLTAVSLAGCLSSLAWSESVVAWGGGQTNLRGTLTNMIAISTALDHCLALGADGTITAWGYDFDGQCDVPAGLTQVVGIAAGAFFSAAVRADGTVVAWGDNQFTQTQVPPDATNVISVSAGRGHVLALKSNGSVEAWGSDIYGQCDVPNGLSNVVSTIAVWNYSLALQSNGTVMAWGINDAGQTDVPPGLTNVVALAGNMEYCLALKSDGTVVSWGHAPQMPSALTGVKAIAAGENHCLALKSDGTIVSWGGDAAGQIDVPASLSNVTDLGASWEYSVALVGSAPSSPGLYLSLAASRGGLFSVLVPTQTNKSYILKFKTSLTDANWIPLPSVAGTGQPITLTDPSATNSHRLYRVQEL